MINLIQPLPFFDRVTEQTRFKETSDSIYKFLSTKEKMIPFQIIVPFSSSSIDSFKLKGFRTEMEIELTEGNEDKIKFITDIDKQQKWVVYFGDRLNFIRENGSVEVMVPCSDFYYYEVVVDGRKFSSELFYIIGDGLCDVPVTMEIEAWHDKNFNGYTFDEGFKFRAFFNCFITNITTEIVDEYTKDGYERQILQRRVISFTHNIELDPLPNSVAIGIGAVTAFRNIVIKENGNDYIVKDITYKQEKVEGGALDTVQLSFTIFDQDIIRTNC